MNWAGTLKISIEDYLQQLENSLKTISEENDKAIKKNIFELNESEIIWKQFFPLKNIYGRRGKFLLQVSLIRV